MTEAHPVQSETLFQQMPKVELHRHLEGSLRTETLLDIARLHGITVPLRPGLRALVQMQSGDPLTFTNFLSKFQTLRMFYRSPEVIARITREAVEDAAADQVRYMELRFTPVALSRAEGFPLAQVIDWVADAARQAEAEFGVITRLIVSINRHEPVNVAEEAVDLAIQRRAKGIVGIDLAGNEANFAATPFLGLLRGARRSGMFLTVHAGEWNGPENVREAIEDLNADRIGHGIRVMEQESVSALASEHGTAFEVCVTSNYQTGAVPSLSEHPLARMLMAGINVTLNTDDPSISQITLSNEYQVAHRDLGLPLSEIKARVLAAAQAAFLPPEEKQALVERLKTELQSLPLE